MNDQLKWTIEKDFKEDFEVLIFNEKRFAVQSSIIDTDYYCYLDYKYHSRKEIEQLVKLQVFL